MVVQARAADEATGAGVGAEDVAAMGEVDTIVIPP